MAHIKQVTADEAAAVIRSAGARVFAVAFRKRSDGSLRVGRFRLGSTVKKGLKGGPAAYNPTAHGLVWVYRMAGDRSESPGNRRSIPIEGIISVTVAGTRYVVNG